ncbi:CarboxypepD_reg-like domain-containing protein [Fodinibius salinus]|uniref:CarboxypepD_reg-like domain-containing protein n=1 Tax=Fodinibius salinus TaxID=860790 RepID=A0A5D3YIR4_9BACT|nr:DUF5686 and carboxypeptidase-like regulatory domain-containing protein [Fodinibius salinus]TYP93388.1 CarboxypepD_reg-like domain-containing protein [Fodinibius salinus]
MSKKCSVYLFLLFLLLAGGVTQAQTTITGTITDAKTGKTLPSANILIKNTYHGTITNTSGNFSLTIPDSLLPATLLVRYIGYQSTIRTINTKSASEQNFALQPSVTEMQEIVVTDEDPGVRIMREVISRKQQWHKKLNTYRADAYTRQRLANDTSIVSITESVSEIFWDKQQGHREVLKSKRQTANIKAGENFAGVSYLPNFYDDNVEIADFELVGVTHPKALDYYNFKLVGQTSLDNKTVFKIKVTPTRKLQPLFKGTVFVLKDKYALLEVKLTPNDVVNFPAPVKSFNLDYKQQFNNFGKSFWLPVDVRINGKIKISMIGLDFPKINFNQISRLTNYHVNTSLPDSLYRQDDLFSVDSTTIRSDSLLNDQINTVPLSEDEQQAYTTIDSSATLEKAFKPSGFLSGFVDNSEGNSTAGFFSFLNSVPGKITPDLRYNRVDQAYIGLKYKINLFEQLELHTNGGYSTGYEAWSYGGGAEWRWLNTDILQSSLGWNYHAETALQSPSYIYNPYILILPNLLGSRGYSDYYRSEGWRSFLEFGLPDKEWAISFGFNDQTETSLNTTTAYDFLNRDNFQTNRPIDEGQLHSIDITAGYNLDKRYNFGITGQKYLKFKFEHSSPTLGSDFDFNQYTTRLSWSFPTFYQRRFLPNTLDVNVRAGTYSGDLPPQKLGVVDVSLGGSSPFGTLKTAHRRPFRGSQYLSVNLEHNFRTVPFEAIGLHPLVERNISIILFGGAAKTWPQQPSQTSPSLLKTTDGVHWEIGASLNGILGLFRIDFATQIKQPSLSVTVSTARLF